MREEQEKAVTSRFSALEERVSTMAPPAVAPTPSKQRGTERAVPKTAVQANALEPRPAIKIVSAPAAESAPHSETRTEGLPAIETGSIAPPAAPPISFGEAVVTPAAPAFGVQLGAGPSLQALRLSWGQLVERHGATLASLEPRVVPPRADGGPYRLIAGPFASRSDADRACTEMGAKRNTCFSTTFFGQPL